MRRGRPDEDGEDGAKDESDNDGGDKDVAEGRDEYDTEKTVEREMHGHQTMPFHILPNRKACRYKQQKMPH